ncbi:hypothetical protein ACFX11_007578 [Malus domestica]
MVFLKEFDEPSKKIPSKQMETLNAFHMISLSERFVLSPLFEEKSGEEVITQQGALLSSPHLSIHLFLSRVQTRPHRHREIDLAVSLSVLNRDISWETYMTTKLITGTCLQLLRRYNKRSESYISQLLDDDGPAYVQVFVSILRDIFKEETVEYVLALIGIPSYRSGKHRTR